MAAAQVKAMRRCIALFAICCLVVFSWLGCATPAVKPAGVSTRCLSATEVYDLISPAMAFVRTPQGSGSGVLIDGGYVVTTAHVVLPYAEVGVAFPNGTVLDQVPVAFVDRIGDLALLGRVSVAIAPVTLVPREDVQVGSDVYLIGYPFEIETVPRATIARGILSRVREWESAGITFFQTHASVAGGQSGGILSTSRGEVIGISSLAAGGRSFALVASALDVLDRLKGLLEGVDVDELGDRAPWREDRKAAHQFTIANRWDKAAFAAAPEREMTIGLTAQGEGEFALYVLNAYGDTVDFANEYGEGQAEQLNAEALPALHFVLVETTGSRGEPPGSKTLSR
jgi:hypothetical protein